MSCTEESVDSTSKALVSVLMSASLPLKLKHHEISRAYSQGTMESPHLPLTSAEDCQMQDPSDNHMCGTQDPSHIGQLDCANRTWRESGSFQRDKHGTALLYNTNQDENDNAG